MYRPDYTRIRNQKVIRLSHTQREDMIDWKGDNTCDYITDQHVTRRALSIETAMDRIFDS